MPLEWTFLPVFILVVSLLILAGAIGYHIGQVDATPKWPEHDRRSRFGNRRQMIRRAADQPRTRSGFTEV